MLMVPPDAAPARRGAAAASIPSVVPAKTSRRVNAALPATGTAVPASKTDKAIILLLAAPLVKPCGKCRPGMRACQHYLPVRSRKLDGAFGRQMAAIISPLAIWAASANVGKGQEELFRMRS